MGLLLVLLLRNFKLKKIILLCLVQLEKQVTEVEQFYESTDNIQGNNSKGGFTCKREG